jgi:hypothetical protein
MNLDEARALLRRADTRIGDRWWAPAGYVAVLLAASVRALAAPVRPQERPDGPTPPQSADEPLASRVEPSRP